MKSTLLTPLALLFWGALQAQEIKSFVDFRIFPSTKAYNSVARDYDFWDPIEHQCGSGRSDEMINTFGKSMSRKSQANLGALAKGEVRLNCVAVSPIQTQLLNGKLLNNQNKRETISCLFGITADELFLRLKDRDYFSDCAQQILYLQQRAGKKHTVDGTDYLYNVMNDTGSVSVALGSPYQLGLLLSIDGGHSLGHSIYIDGGLSETPEYEKLVMDNIDKLKGFASLVPNTEYMLRAPIFFITLASPFENGITGTTRMFNDAQQNILGNNTAIDKGMTELGKKVVKKLLSDPEGHRILIDMKGMSTESRDYVFKYLDRLEILGDPAPVIFSSVGVSGLSWTDPLYSSSDNDAKNANSYLNHWHRNLSKEDIAAVLRTNGIVGISLDEQALAGGKFFDELNKTLEGTKQRRELTTKLLVANILRFIEVAGRKDAWDALCIGSSFDGMLNPSEVYASSEQIPDLLRDLQNFFEKPMDVFDLYSAQQVKTLMYGYSAQAIIHKLAALNAQKFIYANFGKGYYDKLVHTKNGNVEFRLKGNKAAQSVLLAGEFNKWDPQGIAFVREGDDWVCRIKLPRGIYQYKFIIDGKWQVDPSNPETIYDGSGNDNSVKRVGQ